MIELIGIMASVVIVISLFMNGESKLRTLNIVGSIVFIVYGVLIGSVSVVFLNAVSTIVNVVKIHRLRKEKTNEDISNWDQ